MFKLVQIVNVENTVKDDDEGYTFLNADVIIDDKGQKMELYFPEEVLLLFIKHFSKHLYPVMIIQEFK